MYALLQCGKKIRVRYSGRLIDVRKIVPTEAYTLKDYYILFIADVVQELRRGKTAYCFTMRQVKDVARCVRCVTVWLDGDGVYALSV